VDSAGVTDLSSATRSIAEMIITWIVKGH
jgi:hypothetical protein